MENDIVKLKTLLGYWIEHNHEHRREFLEWADRIPGLDAEEHLRLAAGQMEQAAELLSHARTSLGSLGV